MEQVQNIAISQLYMMCDCIDNQVNKLRQLIDTLSKSDEDFKKKTSEIEKQIREDNILEMKSHGENAEDIVNWYWNNYHYSALLVTTPNGNHPINYQEWTEGRMKNNKEVQPEFYKDFMYRVIEKGGYIQNLPF